MQRPDFQKALARHAKGPLRRGTEMMDERTAERVLTLLESNPSLATLDLTGGAPELHACFRPLVQGARGLGRAVIDRCNLTVLLEPGQEDTPAFLASERVKVVASLPCYTKENVEQQRGRDVFDRSIEALRVLNRHGFGQPGSGLELDLVYNPLGPTLPPAQAELESQELELGGRPRTIWDVEDLTALEDDEIATAGHCFGCTAGSGSSCGGALA